MKSLSAAMAGGVGAALLFLAYAALPLLGIPAGALAPLPICYTFLRYGRSAGFLACAAALALVLVVDGVPSGLMFLVQAGALSLLLMEGVSRGLGGARAITLAVGGVVLLSLALGAAWSGVRGVSLPAEIGRGIDASIAQTMAIYERAQLPPEVLSQMKEGAVAAGSLLRETYPALVVMGLMLMAGVSLLVLKRLLPLQMASAGIAPFGTFRNPDHLVWLLIIAGFARLVPPPWGGSWSLNLLLLAGALYFLQGLAVLLVLVGRSAMAGVLRVLLFTMLLFQPYLVLVVTAVGLFDLWGNFRTPRQTTNL
jgi:uncharacterized protein YybS (DUF2232 family)